MIINSIKLEGDKCQRVVVGLTFYGNRKRLFSIVELVPRGSAAAFLENRQLCKPSLPDLPVKVLNICLCTASLIVLVFPSQLEQIFRGY